MQVSATDTVGGGGKHQYYDLSGVALDDHRFENGPTAGFTIGGGVRFVGELGGRRAQDPRDAVFHPLRHGGPISARRDTAGIEELERCAERRDPIPAMSAHATTRRIVIMVRGAPPRGHCVRAGSSCPAGGAWRRVRSAARSTGWASATIDCSAVVSSTSKTRARRSFEHADAQSDRPPLRAAFRSLRCPRHAFDLKRYLNTFIPPILLADILLDNPSWPRTRRTGNLEVADHISTHHEIGGADGTVGMPLPGTEIIVASSVIVVGAVVGLRGSIWYWPGSSSASLPLPTVTPTAQKWQLRPIRSPSVPASSLQPACLTPWALLSGR